MKADLIMKKTILLLVTIFSISGFNSLYAQTNVTFKVNIQYLTEDQSFDPERDQVELIGNRHPLSATRPLEMLQDEDDPDLFSVEVTFPSDMVNVQLEYQYRVQLNHRYHNEDLPRSLRIPSGDQTLDALHFNSYAW